MKRIRDLLESFWICKDTDKEAYYRVKHAIPGFQKFIREQLGWRLIHTEHILKLEKVPAHAEAFMGILEFQEIRDYCILCTVLMFLEDKEEQEQFLLSELIDFVGAQLNAYLEIDWTSFSQRKSLVRVLQFMERLSMLRVYEGSSEGFGREAGQEVLYENTGYSKYFAVSFGGDISAFQGCGDFERHQWEGLTEDRGHIRINRVYRQLVTGPALYWEQNDDPDSLYLKNQRAWVSRYLEEQLGGRLDLHKNAAFWMVEEEDCYGCVHPRDAMLPELVMLICAELRRRVETGLLKKEESERIRIRQEDFAALLSECRESWKEAWSKEYREMEEEKLVKTVLEYMTSWMMVRGDGEQLLLLPAVGKVSGFYPADYKGKEE